MKKHLLLTVGDTKAISAGLRFLRYFFNNGPEFTLTLFYVAPRLGGFGRCSGGCRAHPEAAEAFEKARTYLADMMNFAPENINCKTVPASRGTVGDIISEARDGMYDAVVMGRRGLSRFEELFESSVSHSILWESIDFPIWVCRKPLDKKRKNVLLCVDGSRECLRMADHAGFMLADRPQQSITMFHVEDGTLDRAFIDRYFDEARDALTVNGISEDRIQAKVVKAGNTAKAVLKEAEKNDYAVIATGRKDHTSATGKVFFPGSVSSGLLRLTENCALWISK